MKQIYLRCLTVLLFSLITVTAYAQKKVTGTVTGNSGQPIPGVGVLEKGTKNGAVSDGDGKFTVTVKNGAVLVFSSIGFITKEITVGESSTIQVSLVEDEKELNEVVVTALGVKRDKRSLGYATSSIKQKDLTIAGTPLNPFLAIYGKAAGVGVNIGSGGPMAGININIRGNSSLNGSQNVRPLFVIDGVPIRDNNTSMVDKTYDPLHSFDYGSGINDLNAEDIEGIEVLKGAKAAVLYGAEGAGGVILVTTKSGGSKTQGFGISASFQHGFEVPKSYIDFQDQYGTGINTNDIQYVNDPITNLPTSKRKLINSRWSFGPKFDGSPIMNYDSTMTTYNAHPDNFIDFFPAGRSNNTTIAMTGGSEKGGMRFSYSNRDYRDILPNSTQKNNTFSFNGNMKVSKFASFDVIANLFNIVSTNRRPNIGGLVAFGLNRDYDYGFVKNFYKADNGFHRELDGYSLPPSFNNLKSILAQQLDDVNRDSKTHLITSIKNTLNFTENISLVSQYGFDYTITDYTQQNRVTRINPVTGGKFAVGKERIQANNFQSMLNFDKSFLNNDLRLFAFVGGAYKKNLDDRVNIGTYGNSVYPDFYSFNNEISWPGRDDRGKVRSYSRGSDETYSAFGSATLSWKEKYFLEIQGRNDWNSTLPPVNNSYFYPGASFTWHYQDLVKIPQMNLGTLRLAWANTGFGTSRYFAFQSYDAYTISNTNAYGVGGPGALFSGVFKPAQKSEVEIGLHNNFFNKNRLEIDFSYYTNNTNNEIIPVPLSEASAYSSIRINSGSIKRHGFELLLKGTPILSSGFRWDLTLTGARQYSKIAKLYNGITSLSLAGLNGRVSVVAEEGKPFGDIKMFDYARTADGSKIVNDNGLYQVGDDYKTVGNVTPKLYGGLNSDFSYKGFNLHIGLDYKYGGSLLSISNFYLQGNGVVKSTLKYRDEENGGLAYYRDKNDGNKKVLWEHNKPAPANAADGIVYHNGLILDGVKPVTDGNGKVTYVKNNQIIAAVDYYSTFINDAGGTYTPDRLFKNNYIKVREIAMEYTLPQKFTSQFKLQRLTLTASARNLFYLYKTIPNVDAESALGSGEYQEYSFYPSIRSYNLGVKVNF
ncbi:MAG TPA: SusC/RagA family TonB-linked outer membrane protein [Pedobacter sp.]|nr:SusC/RagA family TonB-linked outer membrane protein [Pedobacter sp.]